MKKLIILILILMISVSLVIADHGEEDSDSYENDDNYEEEIKEDESEKDSDSYEYDDNYEEEIKEDEGEEDSDNYEDDYTYFEDGEGNYCMIENGCDICYKNESMEEFVFEYCYDQDDWYDYAKDEQYDEFVEHGQYCPSDEERDTMIRTCEESGHEYYVEKEFDCEYVICQFDFDESDFYNEFGEMMCPSNEELDSYKSECEEMGLTAYTEMERECAILICEDKAYATDGLEYDADWEVPSSVELLAFVLEVDSIKIEISNVKNIIQDLQVYYQTIDDTEKSKNYNNALDAINDLEQKLDNTIEDIKNIASEEEINYNRFVEIKHDLKSLTDDGIRNVLTSILGI